ncbi:uncharacterized protein YALI1_C16283g [Yarrowia lipolytica]|uniref:Uncharacterized protein n=1 Tax=Yarrowia lipolytica TaxID=4952 RepID=A0A1D8NAP6_YARLL|nr:hypothetical protein YALI1_C16283g [Yarrowia lipolytica]
MLAYNTSKCAVLPPFHPFLLCYLQCSSREPLASTSIPAMDKSRSVFSETPSHVNHVTNVRRECWYS